jgi:hypothetical protein
MLRRLQSRRRVRLQLHLPGAIMPSNSSPNKTASPAARLGAALSAAISRCGGENTSDCGSAICGWPAKIFGDQNGDCAPCSAFASACNCGWKWAFASQGMVKMPLSQGKASKSQHKATYICIERSGQRLLPEGSAPKLLSPLAQRAPAEHPCRYSARHGHAWRSDTGHCAWSGGQARAWTRQPQARLCAMRRFFQDYWLVP